MSCRAYLWYFWIGAKLKGALLWDVETCNFNAGGYAFFAVRICRLHAVLLRETCAVRPLIVTLI